MARNPDNYEEAECPQCHDTISISKESLARASKLEVCCPHCKLWLKVFNEDNSPLATSEAVAA